MVRFNTVSSFDVIVPFYLYTQSNVLAASFLLPKKRFNSSYSPLKTTTFFLKILVFHEFILIIWCCVGTDCKSTLSVIPRYPWFLWDIAERSGTILKDNLQNMANLYSIKKTGNHTCFFVLFAHRGGHSLQNRAIRTLENFYISEPSGFLWHYF